MQDKTQEKSSICTATVTQEGPAKWNVAFEWKDGTFCVPGEYKLYAHPQQAAPAAVAVPDAVRDAEKLLREEAARLERIYGTNKWYGFSAEKDSHIEHLRVAAALAATPAADASLYAEMLAALQSVGMDAVGVGGGENTISDAARAKVDAVLEKIGAPWPSTETAPAAPVVLPEPDGFLESHPFGSIYHRGKPSQIQMICGACPPMYEAGTVRALLATATGLPTQAVELSDAELIALNAGECFFSESPSKYPEAGHGTQYHAGAPGVIAFGRAAIALRADPAAHSQKFQQRVQPWMMACFGAEISADRIERNHRFLEEALELVQSCGCTASEAHQLVDYVFGRPVGDKQQEVGGVMVTLAALCLAQGLDMHAAGDAELARIWTKVEAIRAKQAAKPKHSPLPEHAPQAQADARDAELLAFLQDQCIDLRCFTTSDGEDVGWRTVQHHMSEPRERVVSEVYGDQPRRAIREAMARIERDPYCTGPLHLEDAAAIAAAKGE